MSLVNCVTGLNGGGTIDNLSTGSGTLAFGLSTTTFYGAINNTSGQLSLLDVGNAAQTIRAQQQFQRRLLDPGGAP